MTLIAFLGSLEIGLIFALVALGVFISFRIVNFPDMTVDGSFPLGGAVAATLLVADIIARLALNAAELPIGVVTATLGAPVFIWLLLKAGR